MPHPVFLGLYWDETAQAYKPMRHDKETSGLICAPNRSGKSTKSTFNIGLTYPGTLFWSCPKGEAAAVTGRYRKTLGPCHFIDPFGVLDELTYPPGSKLAGVSVAEHLKIEKARYNVLLPMLDTRNDPTTYAGLLADAVIMQDARNSYFTSGSRQLLQGDMEHRAAQVQLVQAVTEAEAAARRRPPTLVDVYDALTLPLEEFQAYMLYVRENSPAANARTVAATYL
jgi:type IV secretory pathway TraG/TraD family ATPase VirD4